MISVPYAAEASILERFKVSVRVLPSRFRKTVPETVGHQELDLVAKLSKRTVDQAQPSAKDLFLWDDELLGFGLRVFAPGRKSYVVQYRAAGRTRRFTIGPHGAWAPDTARLEARILLGRVAQGENPAEERQLTPHVLRHSFASIANDLWFTEFDGGGVARPRAGNHRQPLHPCGRHVFNHGGGYCRRLHQRTTQWRGIEANWVGRGSRLAASCAGHDVCAVLLPGGT